LKAELFAIATTDMVSDAVCPRSAAATATEPSGQHYKGRLRRQLILLHVPVLCFGAMVQSCA
jgi:hypothetical protein